MSIRLIGNYEDLPIWISTSLEDIAQVDRATLPPGLGIALVLGYNSDVRQNLLERVATAIASMSPTFVHCFGPFAESLHDLIDSALIRAGHIGVPTAFTADAQPSEIIFEAFRTDMPSEDDFDRWSGRLFALDDSLPSAARSRIIAGLNDVDGTIRALLRDDGTR